MLKVFLIVLGIIWIRTMQPPEVKYAGALRNIMMAGDLSTHINIDTLTKKDLYGLGPVSGLKGEIIILNGVVYSSSKENDHLQSNQNKISEAAMLVYSHVQKWKAIKLKVNIHNYTELEKLVEETAKEQGININSPFPFMIQGLLSHVSYHVIDWKEGTQHTMENHHQFAHMGDFKNEAVKMLGFYSRQHQSIYTHHTSFMHLHALGLRTNSVGHLLDIKHSGEITISLATS